MRTTEKSAKSLLAGAIAVIMTSAPIFADVSVLGESPQGTIMRAQVPFSDFAQIYKSQRMSEWCWAASISNIFGFYGHPVAQERIVQTVYGRLENFPAYTASEIAALVNRDWIDDNGRRFRAKLTAAYDFHAGVAAINNAAIIENLKQNHPILICNTQHCMVLTAVDFIQSSVIGAGVFDPWPLSPPAHSLTPAELVPANQGGQLTFIAAVSITDSDTQEQGSRANSEELGVSDIQGTWRGYLNRINLHVVLNIEADGTATLESPDQGSETDATIVVRSSGIRVSAPAWQVTIRAKYEEQKIVGTFSQHGMSIPLSLERD